MNADTDPIAITSEVSTELKALRGKVSEIFRDLVGDRAANLTPPIPPSAGIILKTLLEEHPDQVAYDITHHLTDWAEDGAFLTALHMFPEKFSETEVRMGIDMLLVHVPNHLAAAAKLSGEPVEDIFEVGALSGPDHYEPDTDSTAESP